VVSSVGYHHGNLKHELLDAGLALARDGGLDAVQLRALARATKVTPAATLRHFADLAHVKTAVSQAARELLATQCLADWRALDATVSTRDLAIHRFDALGRRYLDFARTSPQLFAAAFALCEVEPSRPDEPSPKALLFASVDALVREGVIDRARQEEAPLVAWSLVHGMATLESRRLLSDPSHDLDTKLLRAAHRALFADPFAND
jgi:AcrR family transcriptional regulator